MKKIVRPGTLMLITVLVVMNFGLSAQAMMSLQSAEGIITVSGETAMININGTSYRILKENSAYTQFENRHIKMYNIRMGYLHENLIIDFTGFRFIDAFA